MVSILPGLLHLRLSGCVAHPYLLLPPSWSSCVSQPRDPRRFASLSQRSFVLRPTHISPHGTDRHPTSQSLIQLIPMWRLGVDYFGVMLYSGFLKLHPSTLCVLIASLGLVLPWQAMISKGTTFWPTVFIGWDHVSGIPSSAQLVFDWRSMFCRMQLGVRYNSGRYIEMRCMHILWALKSIRTAIWCRQCRAQLHSHWYLGCPN